MNQNELKEYAALLGRKIFFYRSQATLTTEETLRLKRFEAKLSRLSVRRFSKVSRKNQADDNHAGGDSYKDCAALLSRVICLYRSLENPSFEQLELVRRMEAQLSVVTAFRKR